MGSVMSFVVFLFLLVCLCHGFSVPGFYDLNDEMYSEIRELLHHHMSRKGSNVDEGDLLIPREVMGWPRTVRRLGQVAGVSVDPKGRPAIFHRGPTVWDASSFNSSEHFQHITNGPIAVDTILTLDPNTGELLNSWGKDMFYMPHGITIDKDGNTWLTDVALHQVFKFPKGSRSPSMTLGTRFEPGNDENHFCKPTDVAVAGSGEFFVSDGYCNSRILKFSPEGNVTKIFESDDDTPLNVPHSLALIEEEDSLCVADRENMRVKCYEAGLKGTQSDGKSVLTTKGPIGRVFGIAPLGDLLFAVTNGVNKGPEVFSTKGLTLDLDSGRPVDTWRPLEGFQSPHDIAVSPDGSAIYVAEIGPNRVWKFLLEPKDELEMEDDDDYDVEEDKESDD